ncbi:hypothetical protein [Klebsiella spallanzanii]
MITFRLTPDIDEREFVTRYLGNMNIRIWTKKGVDFIAPYTPKEPVKPRYTWTYTPQFDKSPSWYRNMMMTRPERREVRRLLNQVMRGHDADGIAFPVSHRPFVYWW